MKQADTLYDADKLRKIFFIQLGHWPRDIKNELINQIKNTINCPSLNIVMTKLLATKIPLGH